MSWKDEVKHAFALNENEKDTIEPTDEQQVPIDWLSRQVAKRHLTTPIVLTLDICQPLNFVASQTLHFLGPAVWALSSPTFYTNYRHFARFLEHRGSVAHLCRRIQEIEDEYVEKEHGADEQP